MGERVVLLYHFVHSSMKIPVLHMENHFEVLEPSVFLSPSFVRLFRDTVDSLAWREDQLRVDELL